MQMPEERPAGSLTQKNLTLKDSGRGKIVEPATSFISNRSISLSSSPAACTAAGIAAAGPTPITAGSTPTAAKLLQEKHMTVRLEHEIFLKSRLHINMLFTHHDNLY